MRITHEPSLQPIISFSPESRFYPKTGFFILLRSGFSVSLSERITRQKTIHKETAPPAHHPAPAAPLAAREELTSPGNVLTLTFDVADGIPRYALSYKGRAAVLPSRLGFELKNAPRCWMASPCSRPSTAASTRPGNPSGTKRHPSETTTTNWPSSSNSRAAS